MSEAKQLKDRIADWARASATLEAVRRDDIRRLETKSSIVAFDGLFMAAVKKSPPIPESGLVEQQKWFKKLAES